METAVPNPAGGCVYREQFQLQGTVTDLTTGIVYHGDAFFRDLEITTPAGGAVVTVTFGSRLVSTTGQSIMVTFVGHFTVTPDGKTTANFERSISC